MKTTNAAPLLLCVACLGGLGVGATAFSVRVQAPGTPPPAKTKPDARFGNVLFKTPDAAQWTRHEEQGRVDFSTQLPPPDFCMLTIFPGSKLSGDFKQVFDEAVARELARRGTGKIQKDSGVQESKAAEGYPVLQRTLVCEGKDVTRTIHWFVAGHSRDRFDMLAFQTSGEEHYQRRGAEAVTFLTSVKLANSLPANAPVAAVPSGIGQRAAETASANPAPKPAAPSPGTLFGHWVYASGLTTFGGRSYNSAVAGDLILGKNGKFSDSRRTGKGSANTEGTFTVKGDQLLLGAGKDVTLWRFRITPGKDTEGKVFDNLLLYTDAKDLSYGLTRKTN